MMIASQTDRLIRAAGGRDTERGKRIAEIGKRYTNNAAQALGFQNAAQAGAADLLEQRRRARIDPDNVLRPYERNTSKILERKHYTRSALQKMRQLKKRWQP